MSLAALFRMIRFSHTVFALPFAFMAAFLAADGGRGGFCPWDKLFLIVWCTVAARTVAMTCNRIADAALDARNPRTAHRELVTGAVTRRAALAFLALAAAAFGAGTLLFYQPLGPWFGFGNYWPALLAAPVLLFICAYSLTKRFTWASHFWLGASLMLAPLGAWIAVSPPQGPALSPAPLILGLAVLFWTAGFDIIYALQDVAVDRRDGLYSIPANLGTNAALWISRACHAATVALLFCLPRFHRLGTIYLAALAVVALLLLAEHLLVRRARIRHINLAFGTINGIISLSLAAATVADILSRR